MRHLLLFDSESDLKADVENTLTESFMEDICIETARSVSEVLKKSIFSKGTSFAPLHDNYDIFVICLKEMDGESWDFVQYVVRNKPQLPIIIISLPDSSWLIKRFISKTEKEPMHAVTKQSSILASHLGLPYFWFIGASL